MSDRHLSVVLDNLVFPKCPRWHDGKLFFSDVHGGRVMSLDDAGQVQVICTVPGRPAGLGWLPDGRMLVVSMTDRRVMRLDGGRLVLVADLGELASFHCNDMVVDATGRAYVGNFGFDVDAGAEPIGTTLACVDPSGDAWVVVEQLLFPNGMAITPDGRTLIVAESFGQRLSAFDVEPDGSLTTPRVWADLRPNVPDGICLDAQGAVWVADPIHKGAMRVVKGVGSVEWISTGDRGTYSCALGGPDGRTLYLCTAETSDPTRTAELSSGRIEAVRVDVPAVGFAWSPPPLSGDQG